ncbi:MAG: hypothetical protein ACRD41_16005, partial [Candidatus Acidiferrales bacterium]
MKPKRSEDRITRRRFLELGSAASAGILASGKAAGRAPSPRKPDAHKNDAAPITGKIALEEHFALPQTVGESY